MNTHVNFETSKLLKEKGFDEPCSTSWETQYSKEPTITVSITQKYRSSTHPVGELSAPTIAEVVMWLHEKHDVWIMVTKNHYETLVRWDFYVNSNFNNDYSRQHNRDLFGYYSPADAYEAAIEYTLNQLI